MRREKPGKELTLAQLRKYDAQLSCRYGYLLVKDLEFRRKLERKAMRIQKKNQKEADKFVY